MKNMPRDVRTCWNSMYRMLCFAVEYREAIDAMTENRANNLCDFELSEYEWKLAAQLRDVLKVRTSHVTLSACR